MRAEGGRTAGGEAEGAAGVVPGGGALSSHDLPLTPLLCSAPFAAQDPEVLMLLQQFALDPADPFKDAYSAPRLQDPGPSVRRPTRPAPPCPAFPRI